MPRADSPETARRWATEPAIDLWALFAGDLPAEDLQHLARGLATARSEGARIALIEPPGAPTDAGARALADISVAGEPAPSPFGLIAALHEARVPDVRRLGVVGSEPAIVEAAHRAGAGAIVAIVPEEPERRARAIRAHPDVIASGPDFGSVYAERYGAARPLRQRVLLNPGPSVVSDRVHRAIAGPDLCHREPEYERLARGVRDKLRRVAGVDDTWEVVLLTGSGTAAMEAMVGSATRRGRPLLVCRNGVYGERLRTIAARLGIPTVIVDGSPTRPIEPSAVDAALAANPTVDALAVVHHETTTGVLNPVVEIAATAARRGAHVVVDAISSLGAEELPLAGSGIDMVAGTANKCLQGLPGVAFVLLSPRARRRIRQVAPRSLYLDLGTYLDAQAGGSVPFTPAVPAVMALDAALDELLEEGVASRRRRYRERTAYLDEATARAGLECLVAPEHRSASVRSFRLPEGVSYEELHDRLRQEGYVIYAGLGAAASSTFRVCALGEIEVAALAGFTEALGRALGRDGADRSGPPARGTSP
jgi:2-aminoethylphosphonate-pyruvate transaminase